MKIPIEISARHLHLSKKDQDVLFGKNYQFSKKNDLSQPNQYAAQETVIVKSGKSQFEHVRIIGPARSETQLEISLSDAYRLGVSVPVLASGQLKRSVGGLKIIGPKGQLDLTKGVIIAQRHLHIENELAKDLGIKNGEMISIKSSGVRSVTFHNVLVRSEDVFKLSFQIDIDEANAAGIGKNDIGEIVKE